MSAGEFYVGYTDTAFCTIPDNEDARTQCALIDKDIVPNYATPSQAPRVRYPVVWRLCAVGHPCAPRGVHPATPPMHPTLPDRVSPPPSLLLPPTSHRLYSHPHTLYTSLFSPCPSCSSRPAPHARRAHHALPRRASPIPQTRTRTSARTGRTLFTTRRFGIFVPPWVSRLSILFVELFFLAVYLVFEFSSTYFFFSLVRWARSPTAWVYMHFLPPMFFILVLPPFFFSFSWRNPIRSLLSFRFFLFSVHLLLYLNFSVFCSIRPLAFYSNLPAFLLCAQFLFSSFKRSFFCASFRILFSLLSSRRIISFRIGRFFFFWFPVCEYGPISLVGTDVDCPRGTRVAAWVRRPA
ncbi:hypothetical protein C8J57DRAFT_1382633 [Mycena rebaudengoi]|nr:hypothetical protein C8J57DRAFT_1382633 [Mycena rebaudengoi]